MSKENTLIAELTKEQQVWVDELLLEYKKGNTKISVQEFRVRLKDKLSKNFNPYEIDGRVAREDRLKLFGLYLLDPKAIVFKELHEVFEYIKQLVESSPEVVEVFAKDISEHTKLSEEKVESLLYYIASDFDNRRYLAQTASLNGHNRLMSISWDRDSFLFFLYYENIEALFKEEYSETVKKPRYIGEYFTTAVSPSLRYGAVKTKPESSFIPNTAFIIMPINKGTEDTCNAIKDVCNKFSIDAVRSDDIEHQNIITDKIIEKINNSQFLIADLTEERPNVYYEVGYAHAKGKHPILTCKVETKLHFDLAGYNVIFYENNTELKSKLEARMEAIVGKKPSSEK